jgi:hypothetical protein
MLSKNTIEESGSIGADRIPRSAVQPTVDFFINKVLKGFKGFKSAKIAGSYNSGTKKDHGDIDLVVYVTEDDLKKVRQEYRDYVANLPDDVAVPFRTGTNKGKKSQLFGRIATCQVPMQGFEGLVVQIDCVFVSSEKEQEYRTSYLSTPTVKQKLILALARVILEEEKPEQVFARLGITKLPKLEKNQLFEFNLGETGLALNKITGREVGTTNDASSEQVWKSTDWSDVGKLLANYDLTQDFDGLLAQVAAKIKHISSKRRILGFLHATVKIGPGEKGTPKGDAQQRALDAAEKELGGTETGNTLKEEEGKAVENVVLYGGGFKPPHRAHFTIAKKLCRGEDRLIILIGKKVRSGIPITAEQSKEIWEIYKNYLPIPVEIRIAQVSPIGDIYKILENPELKGVNFTVSDGSGDSNEFNYLLKNKEKYPNVKLVQVSGDKEGERLSASTLRKSIELLKKGLWIPKELSREDANEVLNIALKPLEKEDSKMEIQEGMKQVLEDLRKSFVVKENSSGTPVAPTSIISSSNRAKLAEFYSDLVQVLDSERYFVKFNQSFILIKSVTSDEKDLNNLYTKLFNAYSDSFCFHFTRDAIEVTPLYRPDWAKQNMEGGYATDANADNLDEQDDPRDIQKFDWAKNMASMIGFFEKNGMKLEPLPEIILNKEPQKDGLLAKTGEYDPINNRIKVYIDGRHPKDVLRSTAHELSHREQNLNGKIGEIKSQEISEDQALEELEGEAYRRGNLMFRKWTESLKKSK